MTARVIDLRSRRPVCACPVCDMSIAEMEDSVDCTCCGVAVHAACYWGRIATLAEWREFLHQVTHGPENYCPTVRCARCRGGAS